MRTRFVLLGMVLFSAIGVVFNSWQNGFYHWVNGLLLVESLLLLTIQNYTTNQFRKLLTLTGEQGHTHEPVGYISDYLVNAKKSLGEFQSMVEGISEIGEEKFSLRVKAMSDETIRHSLLLANEKIMELRRKDQENNWITHGVAAIAELKHNGSDLTDYSFQVLSSVVNYIHANQGGFFLLTEIDSDCYFELTASYAYGKKRYVQKRINPGEGLIGQVYYEKEIVHITDVPKDYIKITSGLGEALPRCICIIPLLAEDKMLGAIEVASFNALQPHELEYLKKIGQNVGYNLHSLENHLKTERLLVESQSMAMEVKSQEEELRQNMEELQATQEQMKRKQSETNAVLSSLSTIELDLEGKVMMANPVFLGITGFSLNEIQGQLYQSLIPNRGNDSIQYEMMWDSIRSGRSFSGEFRIVNKAQKELWMAGNFTPLLSDEGIPYKVMVISLFITQDKEKLQELQEIITAMKNCFPMAEINPDLTFKTANDLFLAELGIKRLELKKTLLKNIIVNGSLVNLERFVIHRQEQPGQLVLNINDKNGMLKKFNATVINVGTDSDHYKKSLLILRNTL